MQKRNKRRNPVSIGLVSLGCAKNAVDLQVMAGHLLKAGCVLSPTPDEADVLLVNTCAFIEAAREEAADEIMRACDLKRAGRCRAVVVAGCFAQRYGDRFAEVFPDVDTVLGVDALDSICDVVDGLFEADGGARGQSLVLPPGLPSRVFDPPNPALRFTGVAFAYLKIAEGCAHRCAYCAIPGIRGDYRSRPLKSIVAEAKRLLATGVKELDVIAQDPLLYGVDFRDGKRTGIVDLLRALDRLPGEFWIRVLYAYPSEISDGFLDWMATSPHAARYVDVPLQHTDPRVLKAMARGGAVQATLCAAERIRAAVPGVTLRTTVMTGFPGETPAAFMRMLADVEAMSFDHLGAFAFSPEEGTPAAEMPKRPSAKTAERRRAEVMALQQRIWRKKARSHIGRVFRALVVEPAVARLESQAPDVDGVTHLTSEAEPGTFVDVRVVKTRGYDFVADVVPKGGR